MINCKMPMIVMTICLSLISSAADAQVAVRGQTVYTMSGSSISNGVVVIENEKISQVGRADSVTIPAGYRVLDAKVVTPGLIDAHATVGLSGILNYKHDQDQLEHSSPIQPELRAIDAYNTHDELITWIRTFGITTVHTGHAPGETISGQTMIAKTFGNTINDVTLVESAMVAATIGPSALVKGKPKSPGTRGKQMAILRAKFIKAREYQQKLATAKDDKKPDRDLSLEMMGRILERKIRLLITADRAQDIASALRLAKEFDIDIVLDSAAEAYLLIDEIKAAGVPVIIHPSMYRAVGSRKNQSFETAAKLKHAGIPIALQSGFENYVPKVRVVLFEAAIAAANGLTFDEALASITLDAAKLLGVDNRVGSIEVGKDGDLALYDGDPFEYTSHCVGTIINGQVVSEKKR